MNYLLRHFDTVFEVVQGMYLSLINVRLSDDFPCHFSTAFLEIFTAAFVAGAGPSLTILQSSNILLVRKLESRHQFTSIQHYPGRRKRKNIRYLSQNLKYFFFLDLNSENY